MEHDHILLRYLQVSQHLTQHFRTRFGKLNLTFPQALALSLLDTEGPMPISRLAQQAGCANSTISGIVDRLEQLGLAQRQRSELDRRVIQVATTEKYQALRGKLENGVGEYFDVLLESLSPAERNTILQGLQLFDRALTQAQDQP